PAVYRETREAARCGGAVRRRSPNCRASVLCGARRRRGIDRRRTFLGASPCRRDRYAGDHSVGVLGRTEAAKPYRTERAHAYSEFNTSYYEDVAGFRVGGDVTSADSLN